MSANLLEQIDHAHLWHPFTQWNIWKDEKPLIVESAHGARLFDIEGNSYLDGVSSLWCNVHGHSVPELIDALHLQTSKLCHSTLLGLSHRPILELTEQLKKIISPGLNRFFYADSGTTAVEAALRMSLEWWQKKEGSKGKNRTRIGSLLGAYHGDTLGAVSAGYQKSFHSALSSSITEALRLKPPQMLRFERKLSAQDALDAAICGAEQYFAEWGECLAAFIVEPLVQGAAGIWVHDELFLQTVARLCRQYEVLLIADEVAVGFGKTGRMFAVDRANIAPDILVLGKGLSAGYLPISVAVTTEEIFDGFTGNVSEGKTFFYGQTFAGNPLAAAVAKANLELFEKNSLLKKLGDTISVFHELLDTKIAPLPCVFEIRRLGVMIGIEMTSEAGKFTPFQADELAGVKVVREARRRGVIIRPLGNVMVLMPPLVISSGELDELVSVTAESLKAVLMGELKNASFSTVP